MATTIKELIKNSSKSISERQDIAKEDLAKAEDLMTKVFEEGMLPKDAMGLDDAFLEKMYAKTYLFFQAGQYEKAVEMFRVLFMLNPNDARYPMAIASCYHRLNKYVEALKYYGWASEEDPNAPLPYYHAADCLLKLGYKKEALLSLKIMLEKVANDPKYAILKERVEQSVKNLNEGE